MALASAREDHTFTTQRRDLTSVAYRITGNVDDAQDVVQDVWLRWTAQQDSVLEPSAWLRTVTHRAAIDLIRARQRRRAVPLELARPVPADPDSDPCDRLLRSDALVSGFHRIFVCLSPPERVAFMGRAVFALDYPTLAAHLDRHEPAVRQLCHRASAHLREGRQRFPYDQVLARAAVAEFRRACDQGPVERLFAALQRTSARAA